MELRALIITCPKTGPELYTGFAMSKNAFDASTLHDIPIKGCPHCGEEHIWSIEDARLQNFLPDQARLKAMLAGRVPEDDGSCAAARTLPITFLPAIHPIAPTSRPRSTGHPIVSSNL